MELLLLGLAVSVFLLNLFTFVRGKKKGKSASGITIGEDFNNNHLSENITQLSERIDELQDSIKKLNIENRDIKRINAELDEERIRLQSTVDRLTELQKKKDELFTMYLHDIKNPAAAIKSMADLFSQFELTITEQQEVVNALSVTAAKIIKITSDITKILTYEYSVSEVQFSYYPIEKVILEAYNCNKHKAKLKEQELTVDIKTPLPEIEMDSGMVFDAVDNLLDNAIKFSDEKKEIHITAYQENNYIIVQVIDNGPGIPLEEIEKAFQKGGRLTPKPTAGEISTGYGLWIVKKIVESHHGKVWLKSEQNKGSNFGFKIPVNQA